VSTVPCRSFYPSVTTPPVVPEIRRQNLSSLSLLKISVLNLASSSEFHDGSVSPDVANGGGLLSPDGAEDGPWYCDGSDHMSDDDDGPSTCANNGSSTSSGPQLTGMTGSDESHLHSLALKMAPGTATKATTNTTMTTALSPAPTTVHFPPQCASSIRLSRYRLGPPHQCTLRVPLVPLQELRARC
jgi:hypothetical protein